MILESHPGVDVRLAVLQFDPRLPYSFAEGDTLGEEEHEASRRLHEALATLDYRHWDVLDDHATLIDRLRGERFDLALNFCDVGFRNDWSKVLHVPALLEMLEIPYTGSDPEAILLAAHKGAARSLAASAGVPVPDEDWIHLSTSRLPRVYPAFLKPLVGGGSVGVTENSVVHDDNDARRTLDRLRDEDVEVVLAQEFLSGPEYTVGLLGNPDQELEVLPVLEVDYSELDDDLPEVFTHEAKFDPSSPYYDTICHRRAELSDTHADALDRQSRRVFEALGLRDYGRLDFRCTEAGEPRFLDANPNPTWYWNSRLAMVAEWAGYAYPQLIGAIVEAARRRLGAA